MLQDDVDVVALLQPTGAPIARRGGPRCGPRGRSLAPGTWDGTRELGTWGHPPTVRLHPVGKSYAVIRTWLSDEGCFTGWYVNLEQPWTRTQIGFDSRDLVLDVVVSDDLTDCGLKDEDEFEFAIDTGALTEREAGAVRLAAEDAIRDVKERHWPFDAATWDELHPAAFSGAISLPARWDEP